MAKDLKTLFANAQPGQYDERFFNVLFDAMNSADQEGFDYLEFKQALNSLKSVNMDEATRYQSAFAMANTMGLTTQKLESSIEYYIRTLNTEEGNFERAVENQMKMQVHEKQTELASLTANIESLKAQIHELSQKIESYHGRTKDIEAQISEATDKIMTTKEDFHRTMEYIVHQMKNDLEAIKSHL